MPRLRSGNHYQPRVADDASQRAVPETAENTSDLRMLRSEAGRHSGHRSREEHLPPTGARQGIKLLKASPISNAEMGPFPSGDPSIWKTGPLKFTLAHP